MNSIDSEDKTSQPGASQASARTKREKPAIGLTEWQRFFLTRLESLLEKQQDLLQKPETSEDDKRLLSKAVYSTYLDCQAQGIGEQALQVIGNQASSQPSSN